MFSSAIGHPSVKQGKQGSEIKRAPTDDWTASHSVTNNFIANGIHHSHDTYLHLFHHPTTPPLHQQPRSFQPTRQSEGGGQATSTSNPPAAGGWWSSGFSSHAQTNTKSKTRAALLACCCCPPATPRPAPGGGGRQACLQAAALRAATHPGT